MVETPQPARSRLTARDNLTTLQTHILSEEQKYPDASGTFSWILSALALSAKVIADKMRRARIQDVLGSLDSDNVQGERQQKLDVIANEILLRCLGTRSGVASRSTVYSVPGRYSITISAGNSSPRIVCNSSSVICDESGFCS